MTKLIQIPTNITLAQDSIISSQADDKVFMAQAREIAALPHSVILASGGDLDCSRYSLAAWQPLLIMSAKNDCVSLTCPQGTKTVRAEPMDILDEVMAATKPDFPMATPPFYGGAVGYLAYDLKNRLENLPQYVEDDLALPDMYLFLPSKILIHDRNKKTLRKLTLTADQGAIPTAKTIAYTGKLSVGEPVSNFEYEDYLKAVGQVRTYIRNGDVYQVNIAQRLSFSLTGDPFTFWERMFNLNPAPFYAFVNAGDHRLMSTSMERFLLRQGDYLETRPIKGTRPRGKTPLDDETMQRELIESLKENSELSMIVDLLRNDMARVCLPRSVRVREHRRIEAYQNVWHSVSIVSGQVASNMSHGDILKETFPGGSITGCPKIRAMEIIDELEPHARHAYTGSIGYLGWHDNMDLNIAIRTAIHHQDMCRFSVGGGIVYDSREKEEYQETLDKAHTLLQLVQSLENAS